MKSTNVHVYEILFCNRKLQNFKPQKRILETYFTYSTYLNFTYYVFDLYTRNNIHYILTVNEDRYKQYKTNLL